MALEENKFKAIESSFTRGEQLVLEIPLELSMFFKTVQKDQVLYVATGGGKIDYFSGPDQSEVHQHNHFELMYVLHGSLINYIEDKAVHYQAGDGCLMNRNVAHVEQMEFGTTALFINLSLPFLKTLLTENSLGVSLSSLGPIFQFLLANMAEEGSLKRSYIEFTHEPSSNSPLFQKLLDSLQLELSTRKIGANYLQKGLVLRLLDALEDEEIFYSSYVDLELSKDEFITNQVLRAIEKVHGVISRDELSNRLHYTSEHLNRLVKKQTGQSLMKYAQKVKLAYIQQLLTTTNQTLAEISEQVGFQSDSHFYRFFKEKSGQSPDQYRRQNKGV